MIIPFHREQSFAPDFILRNACNKTTPERSFSRSSYFRKTFAALSNVVGGKQMLR